MGAGEWLGVCDGSLGGEECKEEDEGLSLVAGLSKRTSCMRCWGRWWGRVAVQA